MQLILNTLSSVQNSVLLMENMKALYKAVLLALVWIPTTAIKDVKTLKIISGHYQPISHQGLALSAGSEIQCISLCLTNDTCLGVNYNYNFSHCQMLDFISEQDFDPQDGFAVFAKIRSCSDYPCKNGGTCLDRPFDFNTYNRFNCTCLQAFSGSFCEIVPPGYKFHGSSYFKFFNNTVIRQVAIDNCQLDGARLVEIPDQATLNFFQYELVTSNLVNIWIGLYKLNGVWQYPSTGFSLWYTNQPSGDGKCAEVMVKRGYTFNDLRCTYTRNYICEIVIP
ncbi:brevican core protein-like [Tachypleus tridentatus]|uniref:brevican core protein-like n=1 Tax=Tachypleus tridentatus TaxID=6853 RepID=UPI003FD02DF0